MIAINIIFLQFALELLHSPFVLISLPRKINPLNDIPPVFYVCIVTVHTYHTYIHMYIKMQLNSVYNREGYDTNYAQGRRR